MSWKISSHNFVTYFGTGFSTEQKNRRLVSQVSNESCLVFAFLICQPFQLLNRKPLIFKFAQLTNSFAVLWKLKCEIFRRLLKCFLFCWSIEKLSKDEYRKLWFGSWLNVVVGGTIRWYKSVERYPQRRSCWRM